jgi:1-phosphatidylinositol phosphodiesterase
MTRKKKKLRFLWLIPAVLVLAAALYAAGLLYPGGKDTAADPLLSDGASALSDWMSPLGDERPLSLINIPGTHDSGTRFIFPDYFLQDQDTSVSRQLENGYRYLDVRVALNKAGDALEIIHAFGACRTGAALWSAALTYDHVADDALAFLDAHPRETVIFCVKPERSGDDTAAVAALLEQKVAQAPERWFTENRIPTLGEVRGRIVLCRRYADGLGLNFNWADQGDPTVLEDPIAVEGMDSFTLAVQDRYHYGAADKWNAVQYTLRNTTATENTFCLNFLSTAQGKLPHPRKFAAELNGLFLSEPLTAGSRYGVILFDFADAALARAVVDTNLLP